MSEISTSASTPLLPNEGEASSSAPVQEPVYASTATQETTPRGPPPSFADGYESVGGIPALVLKPSAEDAKFTCKAFSKNGSLLATGESDGTIKLWRTTNYTCAAELHKVFTSPVATLAFLSGSNNQISAIDTLGNTRRFTIIAGNILDSESGRLDIPRTDDVEEKMMERLSGGGNPHYDSEIRQQRISRLSEDGDTAATAIISWAARGERCYFTIWHEVCRYSGNSWRPLLSRTHKFVRDDVPFPESFDMERDLKLSRSGDSLLVFESILPNNMVLYCGLGEGLYNSTMQDGEIYAAWGGTEEHVLQWTLSGNNPYIRIHKARHMDRNWDRSDIIAELSLSSELLEVDAQMSEAPLTEERVDVFVFEMDNFRRTKVLVWNATADTVTAEINTSILTKRVATNSAQQQLDQDITFCVSKDGKWIVCLSRRSGRCALASVESSTIAWMYDFAERQETVMPLCFGRVMFSPSQRHFLVFMKDSVFAFAPSVLNRDVPLRTQTIPLIMQTIALRKLWDEDAQVTGAGTQHGTHSHPIQTHRKALLEGMSFMLRKLRRDVLRHKFDLVIDDLPEDEEITDATFSGVEQSLAIVSRQSNGSIKVKIGAVSLIHGVRAHHFVDSQFPSTADLGGKIFTPWRLIYYPIENREGLVVFPRECTPSIMYYDPMQQMWKTERLEMTELLCFCQTDDRSRMCLLDVDGVCILDLASREILPKIAYRVDFTQLPEGANSDSFYRDLLDTNPHLIADDGESIMVPWMHENGRHAVVTPATKAEEWNALLRSTRESHFSCCPLSGGGHCVASINQDNQNLSIAIDSATGNMLYNVKTERRRLERERVICSVSCSVFTVMVINVEPSAYASSDEIFRLYQLGIYSAEEFMPDYHRLKTQQPADIAAAVRRLVEKYGVSALNGPFSGILTIAHEAILDDDRKTLEVIKELLQGQEMELALDLITEGGDAESLLEVAIRCRSTNSVGHIIDLMRHKLVPLGNTAASLKRCWKDLCCPRFRKMFGKALADNTFVFEACRLPVHVDFLNSTRRKREAVHIGTTESFLDWKITKNPEVLRQKWQSQNREVIEDMEKEGNTLQTDATLRFVCIADAAKPGMDGIIRPLLMCRAPAQFFQSDVVRWVIAHKGHRLLDKRAWAFMSHICFLVFFTMYVLIVGRCGDLSKAELWKQILSTMLIAGIAVYGRKQLREEFNQLKNSIEDGKEWGRLERLDWIERFDLLACLLACLLVWSILSPLGWLLGRLWDEMLSWFAGVLTGVLVPVLVTRQSYVSYYFRSKWNLLDLLSGTLLLVLIPTFHCIELFISGYQKLLSVFTSIGIIVAYLKVWYHVQASPQTAELIMIIEYIFREAGCFLALAFIVLCGFALALSFLFRHAAFGNSQLDYTNNESSLITSSNATELQQKAEDVQDAFGNILRSVETLFFALLGDFDRDVYRADDELGGLIVGTFILYLITLVILLLNLLIATMGDTFDKVRNNQDTWLLKSRAKLIDACEAALSDSEREKIAGKVGTYVHVVSDPENLCDEEEAEVWTGRLNAIEHRFKKHFRESEQARRSELQTLRSELQAQEERLAERTGRIESRMAAMNEDMTNRMDRLLEHLVGPARQTPGSQSDLPAHEAD